MTVLSAISGKAQDYPKTSVGITSATLATIFGGMAASAIFLIPGLRKLPTGAKAGIIGAAATAGAALPALGYGGYKEAQKLRSESSGSEAVKGRDYEKEELDGIEDDGPSKEEAVKGRDFKDKDFDFADIQDDPSDSDSELD